MVRIRAKEAVRGLHGAGRVTILPGGVNEFDLRLLSILAEGVARFKLLIVVLRLRPIAIIEGCSGFGVKPVGRPIERRVLIKALQPRAGSGRKGHRDQCAGAQKKPFERISKVHDDRKSRIRKRARLYR